MTPQDTQDTPFFHLKAQLTCGAVIEFLQPERHMNLTITLTPPVGIPIDDVAQIKDGKLVVRSTDESLVGVYQIMKHMAGDQVRPRRKFLGIF